MKPFAFALLATLFLVPDVGHAQINDCADAFVVCSDAFFIFNPNGPGVDDFADNKILPGTISKSIPLHRRIWCWDLQLLRLVGMERIMTGRCMARMSIAAILDLLFAVLRLVLCADFVQRQVWAWAQLISQKVRVQVMVLSVR
jgi:hypothetical protein